eukprot:1746176-Rhodomonas_salina.1
MAPGAVAHLNDTVQSTERVVGGGVVGPGISGSSSQLSRTAKWLTEALSTGWPFWTLAELVEVGAWTGSALHQLDTVTMQLQRGIHEDGGVALLLQHAQARHVYHYVFAARKDHRQSHADLWCRLLCSVNSCNRDRASRQADSEGIMPLVCHADICSCVHAEPGSRV